MGYHASGRSLRGILTSNDVTSPTPIPMYDSATGAVYTIQPNDVLVLYALMVNNGDSDNIVTIFSDINNDNTVSAGEFIWGKSMLAFQDAGFVYPRGLTLPKSVPVKAVCSSASTNLRIILYLEVQE